MKWARLAKSFGHTHRLNPVRPKDLGTLVHFISRPRPMPRRKKCPMTNKGNPDCQDILSRTTLSLADQNHKREGATSPEAVPSRIPKEISSPMG